MAVVVVIYSVVVEVVADLVVVVDLHSWSEYFSRSDFDCSRLLSCSLNVVCALETNELTALLLVVPIALSLPRMVLMLSIAVV